MMATFEILSTKYFLCFKTLIKICGSKSCIFTLWSAANSIKDEQQTCETDGFIIFNGIGKVVFLLFLEALLRKDWKYERNRVNSGIFVKSILKGYGIFSISIGEPGLLGPSPGSVTELRTFEKLKSSFLS